MKKTDIAMIILIASFSMIVSYFVTKSIMGDASNKAVVVKVAEPISSDIADPDPRIFNSDAINPTVEVTIGSDDGSGDTGDSTEAKPDTNTAPTQENASP